MDRCPAAIGLFFFLGCFRSASTSLASLNRYPLLETRQKPAKANMVCCQASQLLNSKENTIAANRKTFFAHCLGRIAFIAAIAKGTFFCCGVIGSPHFGTPIMIIWLSPFCISISFLRITSSLLFSSIWCGMEVSSSTFVPASTSFPSTEISNR